MTLIVASSEFSTKMGGGAVEAAGAPEAVAGLLTFARASGGAVAGLCAGADQPAVASKDDKKTMATALRAREKTLTNHHLLNTDASVAAPQAFFDLGCMRWVKLHRRSGERRNKQRRKRSPSHGQPLPVGRDGRKIPNFSDIHGHVRALRSRLPMHSHRWIGHLCPNGPCPNGPSLLR